MARTYKSLHKALTVFELLQGEELRTKQELADAVGVEPRTVKSYIETFREFGWPIESEHAKGFRLPVSAVAGKFTEEELLLFAILLAQGASVLPGAEFERLSAKLFALLPDSSTGRVRGLNTRIEGEACRAQEMAVLAAVGRCLADPHLQLVADYKKNDEDEVRRRQLLPVKLRYQDGCCYLDCFDLEKRGERSFRLDRFVSVQLLRQSEPIRRPIQEVEATHKWDFGHDEPVAVRLEVSERLWRWLKEKPEHGSQVLSECDGSHFAGFEVRRLDFFVDWVMGLRGARALAPMELVEAVRERALALLDSEGTLGMEWG